MDVVILCGGKGTRLQPVLSDRPKALAPFGKVTFLDILIASLKEYGFEKFILCTGYMKEQIQHHFEYTGNPAGLFSEEDVPLRYWWGIAECPFPDSEFAISGAQWRFSLFH